MWLFRGEKTRIIIRKLNRSVHRFAPSPHAIDFQPPLHPEIFFVHKLKRLNPIISSNTTKMSTASGKAPPKPPSEIVKKDVKKEGTPVKEEKSREKSHDSDRDRDRHDRNDRRDNRDRDRQGDRDRFRRGGRGGQGRGGFHRGGGRDQGHQQQQGGFGQQGGYGQQGGFNQQGYQEEAPMFMVDDTPKEPKKFTGRCRLFVGNITPETTEEQFKEMFTPYGEVSEVFVNAGKGFGFIRLVRTHK